MPPPSRSSIYQVAQEAGVSITTVSHALNGKGRVDPATRLRVLDVARRLGYSANVHAQSLATGRTKTIGVQISGSASDALLPGSFYFSDVLNGASVEAIEAGYMLVLVPRTAGRPALERLPLEGALVVDPVGGEDLITALSARDAPVVTTGRVRSGSDASSGWVDNDHGSATLEVLNHVDERGYRRPALLVGPAGPSYVADMVGAYESWTRDHGRPHLLARAGDDSAEAAVRATRALLSGGEAPDAIYAGTDELTFGAIAAAEALGLRVPEDLGVAAAMDSRALRRHVPAITSVDLHAFDVGRAALRMLISLLDGPAPAERFITVPTQLVCRASTRGA